MNEKISPFAVFDSCLVGVINFKRMKTVPNTTPELPNRRLPKRSEIR